MFLRRGLFGLTLMLGVAPGAALPNPSAPERGLYTFEIVRQQDLGLALPRELREPAVAFPTSPLLDVAAPALLDERTVTIEWTARERPSLRRYRVTALIDGGPLSGLAARWDVVAGSACGGKGSCSYRVRLPVPLAGSPRLRASIEAFGERGGRLLLAVGRAGPWARSANAPVHSFRARLPRARSASNSARDEQRNAIVDESAHAVAQWTGSYAPALPHSPAAREAAQISRGPPGAAAFAPLHT